MGRCPKAMAEPTLKILGLAGEYRASSKSGMLVNEALNMAAARGAEVVFWDLAAQPLPLVGRMAVGLIQRQSVSIAPRMCDAFFLSSEYHGTMSGAMKNTMDWMYDKHVGEGLGPTQPRWRHQRQHTEPHADCSLAARLACARTTGGGSRQGGVQP